MKNVIIWDAYCKEHGQIFNLEFSLQYSVHPPPDELEVIKAEQWAVATFKNLHPTGTIIHQRIMRLA